MNDTTAWLVRIFQYLFGTLLVVFILTAIVTLLGIIKVFDVETAYLGPLVNAVLIETAGVIIGLVATLLKLITTKRGAKISLNFPKPIDVGTALRTKVKYEIMESSSPETEKGECRIYQDGQSLFIDLKEISPDQIVFIDVKIGDKMYQGSKNLGTHEINLKQYEEV